MDLLDLFGDGYVAQHVWQEIDREQHERGYRAFITDALYVLTNGGLRYRWQDVDPGLTGIEPDTPPAQEITTHLLELINEGRDPVNESI